MCENFRSVTEAILEWEGRDRSGAGSKDIDRGCPAEQ